MNTLLRLAGLGVLLTAGLAGSAGAFTFDWPVPGRADVTIDMLKRERAARFSSVVSTERAADGETILVHWRDFQPLVFDGHPIETPLDRAMVMPAIAVAAAVPSLRIAQDGAFAGFEGEFDEVFDRLDAIYGENAQAAQVIRAMRETPQMRDAAAMKVIDTWSTWVGTWIDVDLAAGESRSDVTEVRTFGQSLRQKTTITHDGASDACAGCVTLRWEGVLDDPAFRRGWESMMRSVAAQAGNAAGLEEFLRSVESIRRVATIRLETNPETLQPHVVVRENTVFLRIGDGPEARQVERTTYRFTWHEPAKN